MYHLEEADDAWSGFVAVADMAIAAMVKEKGERTDVYIYESLSYVLVVMVAVRTSTKKGDVQSQSSFV